MKRIRPANQRPSDPVLEAIKVLRKEFESLPKTFRVEEFTVPLKATLPEMHDPHRITLVVRFGRGADVVVARDLSHEQVSRVIEAGSLSVLKPSSSLTEQTLG